MTNKVILSPSSINLFIEEPSLWVMKHFYKIYGDSNIFAVRGKLVEEVVNLSLGQDDIISYEEFLPYAIGKTLIDNVIIKSSDYQDFYDWGCKIEPYIGKTYEVISQQDRVEGELFGMKVAGYIDYKIDSPESGEYYLDLKTVNKLPHILTRGAREGMLPAFKAANVRQQVIYGELTGLDTALLFANPEGEVLHYSLQEQDYEEHLPIVHDAIKKIKKLLTMKLEDVIIDIRPEKTNSFFWDDKLRAEAKKIWDL